MAKRTLKPAGNPLPKVADDYIDPAPTTDEVNSLVALWDLYAPPKYIGLMRAQNKDVLEQTKQKPIGRFIWDAKARHYIEVKTGHVITRRELHAAYSEFTRAFASR